MTDLAFEFEGLRGVGHMKLSFTPEQRVYALFGINGVGKTKCLEALFQYFVLLNKNFAKFAIQRSFQAEKCVAGSFDGPIGEFLGNSADQRMFIKWLQPHHPAVSNPLLPCVYLGAAERGHVAAGEAQSGNAVGSFEQRRERHFDLILSGMTDNFPSLGMHSSLEQWFVTLAQSANPYQKGGDNRKVEIDTLLQLLHKIDSRYDETFMEIDGANRVSLKVDGVSTELRHLSTGFTSLVKILQAIISGYANFTNEVNLTRVKGYVFIDEIESHLHLQWQSKIVLLLKELFPNTTFFLATHSPIVLSQLHEGEAYLLERKNGEVASNIIKAPDKRILSDVMVDAMGINLNLLKVARMSAESQKEAKAGLRRLLLETPGESGDA